MKKQGEWRINIMPMKARNKRRTFWTIVITLATLFLAMVIIPPMINLNGLRPKLESAIFAETGVPIQILGDVNFGLLGRTTIVAHKVKTPNGLTERLSVQIPFSDLFDMQNATLNGAIKAYGANINITTLSMLKLKYHMDVTNSVLHFMGKDYYIIRGTFNNGTFSGIVRTDEHKYDINFHGNEFTIKNKNLNLDIAGEFFPSGGAVGTMEISTNKINSWFGFDEPRIPGMVKLSTDFRWNGGHEFKFFDLVANTVHGYIDIAENGWRTIVLSSDDVVFDFSFLSQPSKFMRNSKIDVDFYGDLSFNHRRFQHVKIDAISTEKYIQITKIIADNLSLTGGTIDENGAHEILIKTVIDGKNTECLFSGTPDNWKCETFKYGDITGNIKIINKNTMDATIVSNRAVSLDEMQSYIDRVGVKNANIRFKFANIGGKYTTTPRGSKTVYDYVYGKNLRWLNPHMKLLPDFMMNDVGNIVWNGDTMTFIPNSQNWSLTLHDNFFYLTGNSIKKWLPDSDLRAINDFEYVASGFYNDRGDISDLTLKIAGHIFTGKSNSNGITLHTEKLVMDTFINQDFFARYQEMEYIANAPILLPFESGKNVYLSADKLVYGENTYKNFIYSLKSGTQTFSITDNDRGNLLATIIKERSEYDIFIQLNKFVINGLLLSSKFPLNIMNTSITAEMNLKTNGHIAHDIWYNMTGDADISFDGGYLTGIGIDKFYDEYDDLTRLNISDRLMTTLESGITKIKKMRIIGQYVNGVFETTVPLQIWARYTDIIGTLKLDGVNMDTQLNISMRGTSSEPTSVFLAIAPNGHRGYSLSEIIKNFDPAYMRSFIRNHDMF
jgi:hypothetical protein